jgi:hypothetical protein
MNKEYLAIAALVASTANVLPYMWSIWRGRTRPHAFTWIVWGLVMGVGAAAQVVGGAGTGAWNLAYGACLCLILAALTIVKVSLQVTRNDWITFGAALATIPLWYITKNPLWSLLLAIAIDGVGYWFIIRNVWAHPEHERALFYTTNNVQVVLSILALQTFNFITAAYPMFMLTGNLSIAFIIVFRRRKIVAKAMAVAGLFCCLGLVTAQACSPDQYTIVDFTPAIGHWQDAQGQETGQQQPTFSGRIASQCRNLATVEIEISGLDTQGKTVQQAITTVKNVPPSGADFDYTSLLPYDARAVSFEASVVRVQ